MSIILSTQFSFSRLFGFLAGIARDRWAAAVGAMRARQEEKRREKQRQEVVRKHLEKAAKDGKVDAEPVVAMAAAMAVDEPRERQPARAVPAAEVTPPPRPTPRVAPHCRLADAPEDDVAVPKPSRPASVVGAAAAALKAASARPTPSPAIKRPPPTPTAAPLPLPEPEKLPAEKKRGAFTPPPLALLDPPRGEQKIDERELMEGARLLEEKCREFSVEGSVVQIHPGPVVTTYEFKPDAGVKYSKITGLADDLCLAMQAESVLIDRIPGQSTVGIQIPNPNREQISMRELLEGDAYRRSASKLTLALGKTIHGEPFVSDLATMPHLLIAGSTGTGKSVSVNAMLSSILFRASPDDVRLIMIDPKRLELGMYEDIPHLLTPVVVDPKQASNALRWAVREMEERYKLLAAVGVRNIEQYNRNLRLAQTENNGPVLDDNGNEVKTLPVIVVLIDELADLMMVAGNEVEESIARLAQMARAIGIHLILATQRPSVDVITGLIKANLPARISFRVSSKIDSRTILDGNGAEQLLGKGDMLYLPPASSRFVRLHGPYISEQESARLASFLRKQGKPTYDETITAGRQGSGRRSRVREGRPLRRGGADRRLERPGLDLLPAATAADRLQPGGAAGRHDGSRRAGVGRGGRQGPRSAREEGLLRRGRRATALDAAPRTDIRVDHGNTVEHERQNRGGDAVACALALAPSPAHAAERRATVHARAGARAGAARRRAAADGCDRFATSSQPTNGWYGAIRPPATATTRCGRPATFAARLPAVRRHPIGGRAPASHAAEGLLPLEHAADRYDEIVGELERSPAAEAFPTAYRPPTCRRRRRRRRRDHSRPQPSVPRPPPRTGRHPAPAKHRAAEPSARDRHRIHRRDRRHSRHHADAAARRPSGQHRDERRDRVPPGAAGQPTAGLLRPEERPPGDAAARRDVQVSRRARARSSAWAGIRRTPRAS